MKARPINPRSPVQSKINRGFLCRLRGYRAERRRRSSSSDDEGSPPASKIPRYDHAAKAEVAHLHAEASRDVPLQTRRPIARIAPSKRDRLRRVGLDYRVWDYYTDDDKSVQRSAAYRKSVEKMFVLAGDTQDQRSRRSCHRTAIETTLAKCLDDACRASRIIPKPRISPQERPGGNLWHDSIIRLAHAYFRNIGYPSIRGH